MNGKLRVAAIGVALSVAAVLLLLVVRPSLDPAQLRPLPLHHRRVAGVPRRRLAAAEGAAADGGGAHPARRHRPPGGRGVRTAAYSNDLYRYMWDGRVQAAGIDPYQYVPTATQLTGLRNEFLFYPEGPVLRLAGYVEQPSGGRTHRGLHQDQPADRADHLPAGRRGVLPRRLLPASGRRLQHCPSRPPRRGRRARHGAAAGRAGPGWGGTCGWPRCGRGARRWPWRRATAPTWT